MFCSKEKKKKKKEATLEFVKILTRAKEVLGTNCGR